MVVLCGPGQAELPTGSHDNDANGEPLRSRRRPVYQGKAVNVEQRARSERGEAVQMSVRPHRALSPANASYVQWGAMPLCLAHAIRWPGSDHA